MIQRVQSIYLLLVAGLMLAMLFTPVAFLYGDASAATFIFKSSGIYSVETGEIVYAKYAVLALILVTVACAIATIFFFKKRPLQIKLIKINSILIALVYVLVFVYGQCFIADTNYSLIPRFSILLPLISIIVAQLAARNIRKDENLVRSLDRIR